MKDVTIKVENISKKFFIGQNRSNDLRGTVGDRMKRLIGNSSRKTDVFWALQDISFEVNPGEAVGIIGKNGAGKSTLLKILSRITEPTKGRFEISGRVSSLLEVGTGFHPELTGRENIYLNGTILGMKRTEIRSKFDSIVDFSGIEKFIDTPIKHFSSGMKVRLAFSVAAYLEPEVLIVDEVLAVGDAEFQKKCLGKMDEVSKSRERVVIFVSHNMSALKSICTKGIFIMEGRIKFMGDMNNTIDRYFSESNDEINSGKISQYRLNDTCLIEDFSINKTEFEAFEDFTYKLTFSSNKVNRISELALLFYTEYQERIAIVDLRSKYLHKISEKSNSLTIEGKIEGIPLIEGKYNIGLYVASNYCTGNFLDLIKFGMKGRILEIAPYPVNVRGFVEMKNQFNIYE